MSETTNTKTKQPAAGPQMSPTAEKKEESLIRGTSEALLKGGAKKAGEEGVSYETEHAQEQLDDAKAQAQGLWAKYCGCLGSA